MAGGNQPSRQAITRALAVLSGGATLRDARDATGLPVSFLYRLDAHRRRRGPNVSPAERRNIERQLAKGQLSQRAIARRVRRAASTVNRVARLAERRSGRRQFRRLRKPVRCPRHGWIRLWPCVACTAADID